jgi:hypothetical protein
VAYKKNTPVLPFQQPIHPRFKEQDCFETRRHWRHIPNHNVKPKTHK